LMTTDVQALADELSAAYSRRRTDVTPPSTRGAGFDLASAYAVEAELTRRRREAGHATVGRKVGYANKAVWRVFKLDTLVWAQMYDDTVRHVSGNTASLSMAALASPKIEPEIVFKLKSELPADGLDAAGVLQHVEWMALGFEIIDCVYKDWQFQPADFVAAYGLHAALIVGAPLAIEAGQIATLADQLPTFTVRLSKNGEVVAEGSGRNSLRSPALCLAELAAAIQRQPGAPPLGAGELVSSGTLTESQPIAAGERWIATVAGIELAELSVTLD
jgi:2-oxo-3-hexenedioate decarboxylase